MRRAAAYWHLDACEWQSSPERFSLDLCRSSERTDEPWHVVGALGRLDGRASAASA
jgi:hypothetical protein